MQSYFTPINLDASAQVCVRERRKLMLLASSSQNKLPYLNFKAKIQSRKLNLTVFNPFLVQAEVVLRMDIRGGGRVAAQGRGRGRAVGRGRGRPLLESWQSDPPNAAAGQLQSRHDISFIISKVKLFWLQINA